MIPDSVFIWVSFFLAQRPSSAYFFYPAGVILLGAMRTEAFGEKDLEDLVLESIVDLFVHGLSHFGVVTSD